MGGQFFLFLHTKVRHRATFSSIYDTRPLSLSFNVERGTPCKSAALSPRICG